MASEFSPRKAEGGSDQTLRGVLSLLIFIHLFCVLVVLSSNFRRSRLQARLVTLFEPYTKTLDFDPDFTPYYYTFGRQADDDATFTLDLYADGEKSAAEQPLVKTVQLPDGGSAWLGDRRRYFALAKVLAENADPEIENDDATSAIARAVGYRILRENRVKRAVVRCVQRSSQPLDISMLLPGFPANDPTAAPYNVTLYEADVWIDEDNQVQAIKRAARAEVAPRQSAPPASRGGSSSKTGPKSQPKSQDQPAP